MKLFDEKEFRKYIENNYPLVITSSKQSFNTETSGNCDFCKRDAFLKIHTKAYTDIYKHNELPRFIVTLIECPNCRNKSFVQLVQFSNQKSIKGENGGTQHTFEYLFYRLYRIPVSDKEQINSDIPEKHTSLKKTINEANYCLSKGKYIASAIMFRRGIEILVKDILGAKGRTLFKKLEWLKSNENLLKIDLTEVFHENSKIIKNIGNQGAHPDDDITLHAFKKEDADGMHDLFLSIVYELFTKPKRMKALQEELKASRKLK